MEQVNAEATRVMALARIITRSQACSRQLAIDLLSRGYAVEIVSPDAIPDNIADLELRVEEDPGNQLVATVEAHNGERSASLEFLHYLKAPMPDFVRRPPETQPSLPLVEQPRNGDAPLSIGNGIETANASQVSIPVIAPLPETADDLVEEHLLSAAAPLVQPRAEVPTYFAAEETIVAPKIVETISGAEKLQEMENSQAEPPRQRQDRSPGWLWRTALTSCALIVLALLLAFGVRRNGQASGRLLGPTVPEQGVTVPADSGFISAADSGKESKPIAASSIAPANGSEASSGLAIKQIPVTDSVPKTKSTRVKAAPRHHEDDIVARDTVTYLDRRFAPSASNQTAKKSGTAKRGAGRHRSPHHQGDVVAANKVTYLDKLAAKSAK